MKIEPKIEDQGLQRRLAQQIREQPKQVQNALSQTALFFIGLIRDRTSKGTGAEKAKFPAYSTEYKEIRRQNTRQTAFRDLNYFGNMMSGMYFTANSKRATIQFNTREYKKAYHNEMFLKNRGNTFFSIGKNEENVINKRFTEAFIKQIKLR
jgi:hypothetical protein